MAAQRPVIERQPPPYVYDPKALCKSCKQPRGWRPGPEGSHLRVSNEYGVRCWRCFWKVRHADKPIPSRGDAGMDPARNPAVDPAWLTGNPPSPALIAEQKKLAALIREIDRREARALKLESERRERQSRHGGA